jgi:hypothetical protein
MEEEGSRPQPPGRAIVARRFAMILVSSDLLACDYRFAKPRSITLCENSVISREVYTRGTAKMANSY